MAERLFQAVTRSIEQLIESGDFPPGSRLPGERELAERLGVSRVTVREAAIALQAIGRVEIKTGSGVYVADPPAASPGVLPEVSAFELTEARALFEAEAAALAAPIITADKIAELDALLEVMAAEDGETERSTEADRQFHALIAAASGNRAIIHVINELWRLRTEVPQVRDAHAAICRGSTMARQQEHKAIVDALRDRDSKGTRIAMRQHFRRLLDAMLDENEARELSKLQRRVAESRERFSITSQI